MTDDPSVILKRARTVLEAGEILRGRSVAERARWLEASAQALSEGTPLGREARAMLPEETALSDAMVAWALRTTLGTVSRDALLGVAEEATEVVGPRPDPISLLSVVLAGNVFTASVRGIVVPLLFGVPVLVKASSRETRFPTLIREALRCADAELGMAMDLVVFRGGDADREAALVEPAEAVAVYGTDETVSAIKPRIGGHVAVIAHGHGVSVAYCSARSLTPESIDDVTARVALDLAAYDQRGCLSPQVIYVEDCPGTSVDGFTTRLSGALEAVAEMLPRGPLPEAVGAAQTQWRGLAEVEGTLVRGREHALAINRHGAIRWSPGYRNATIVPVRDLDDALASMKAFAAHLKCAGTDSWTLRELTARFLESASWKAYATEIGTMQTPALEAPADGSPVWEGLFRARRR
ncbi:MAG: hypothetical protein OEM15_16815 [Myxococcales bacterium]|nr:hypothetical protein [Myxococcales bacterium]MDH3482780.1 hypothetical protein [Myxococcales bacterium]